MPPPSASAVAHGSSPCSFRFRPQGPGRFLVAAFLSFWLCGWLVGELFALGLLWQALATPQALGPVAVFLLIWLSLWTLGGYGALATVLRCFWSEDRLQLEPDSLRRQARLGPFRRSVLLPTREIRRVLIQSRSSAGGALVAELPGRSVVLTRLGSLTQRQEAAAALQAALRLPAALGHASASAASETPGPVAALPPGWQVLNPSFGAPLLVPDERLRRRQARVMGVITLALTGLLGLLLKGLLAGAGLWVPVVLVGLLSLACGWGFVWLWLGRPEWRLEPRRLVLQRRFGARVRILGEAQGLELVEATDSDGDPWYELRATRPGAPPLRIDRDLRDPLPLAGLGLWLARQARVPFTDRVPTDAQRAEQRQAELRHLRQQLEGSGRVGRWLVQRLERARPDDAGGGGKPLS